MIRYVLTALGVVMVVLAVVLAAEGLWWAAIPDAVFGMALGWGAFASARHDAHEAAHEAHPHAVAAAPDPLEAEIEPSIPPPDPAPRPSAAPAPPSPAPAARTTDTPVIPPVYAPAAPGRSARHAGKGKKGKHRRR